EGGTRGPAPSAIQEITGGGTEQEFRISRKLADTNGDVVIEQMLFEPKFGEAGLREGFGNAYRHEAGAGVRRGGPPMKLVAIGGQGRPFPHAPLFLIAATMSRT